MYNLGDDKELDRLSREAAGKYNPPGQPDWEAMHRKLDEIMPVEEKKRRIIFFWWLFPLLLLGGGAAYWLIQNSQEPFSLQKAATPNAVSVSPSVAAKDNAATNPAPSAEPTTLAAQRPVQTVNAITNKHRITPASAAIEENNGSHAVSIGNSAQKKQVSGNPRMLATNEERSHTDATVTTDKSLQTTTTGNDTKENTAAVSSSAAQATGEFKTATAQAITPQATETNSVQQYHATEERQSNNNALPGNTDTLQAKTGTIKQKAVRHNGFSIAFVAGVDKSTVKFKYGNDAGINLGLLAGYHFSNRWSLHTGAIYTQKNYKLAGEDFTAPKGTPMSYYKIETLEGYCRMWEVPLVARYTLNPAAKNTTFISTGLSSYFMTKEKYSYLYYYNNQPITRTNTYNSSDTHVLSIWDLSVGFNKPIGKSWSMQVEPYAKIPLAGVGLGNIRLSSFGINFSMQFRQPAKK